MKNIYSIIILCFCISLFNSCSDNNQTDNNPTENNNSKYSGSWLWFRTAGGFVGRVITPDSGVTVIFCYDNLSKFMIFRNDSLKASANYITEKSEFDHRDKILYTNVITYDFYFNPEPDYAEIQTDTLVLWDGMIDGYFSFYKKIK